MTHESEAPYSRYNIDTKKAPNLVPQPNRFKVKVNRWELAKFLIKELFHYRFNLTVVKNPPCVYGVFSGPIGGFAARQKLCVGCLRCTTQYPKIVRISKNCETNTVMYEAETGHIPIKGAGYRGQFGGSEWDGMWTDMSEIVRPTRDGIHGRETISTEVNIGGFPPFLDLKNPHIGKCVTIPIPIIFDPLKNQEKVTCTILTESANSLDTYAILPINSILKHGLTGLNIIPLVGPKDLKSLLSLRFEPALIEIDEWDESFYYALKGLYPDAVLIVRSYEFLECYRAGVRVFHLTDCSINTIRAAHNSLVKMSCRNEVTLIGSGTINLAEHVPKAILCGLDVVALESPLMTALQNLPKNITIDWGKQRIKNLIASWRDQLLEILGAMGLREVRRMRGEMGRAMFQKDLEKEAFEGIEGYARQP